MKDFNNDKNTFNKSLKKKFDAASIEPSDAVWEGIEGALLKHENGKMQKRAVFYRNIAAAVLLIATVSIYFNVQDFYNGSYNNLEIVDITDSENNVGTADLYTNQSDILSRPKVSDNNKEEDNTSNPQGQNSENIESSNEFSTSKSMGQEMIAKSDKDSEGTKIKTPLSFNQLADNTLESAKEEALAEVVNEENVKDLALINDLTFSDNNFNNAIAINNSRMDRVDNISPDELHSNTLIIPEVEVEEVSYFAISNLDRAKSGSNNIAFQSAFNVGSGSFNPNANISAGAPQPGFAALNAPGSAGRTNTSSDAAVQEQYSAERQLVDDLSNAPIRSNVSMTFGLQFGVHLNDRLKIRTGLQYGNYRSSTESSAVIRDINSDEIYPYHGASNATELAEGKIVNITSEYNVQNDFQILSVPLIVSYKFLDRKFGIGLVAGATADIMLRNTIRGGDEQISEISFENHESQSYKNLFYSGIAGVEFSYSLSKNYSLSLTPTYKKALMNITHDEARFSSAPDFLSVDMSLQFTF